MASPNENKKELIAKLDGFGLELWKVHIDALKEQKVNARVMSNETFERLVSNIKKDKRLESLPFCFQNDKGQFEIISGHHRVRTSRVAGITEIFILLDPNNLTNDQVVSKQLAHNAISGKDDMQMLAELFNSIEDVMAKLESGIDPKELQQDYDNVNLKGLSFNFETKKMQFSFLPEGFDMATEVLNHVEEVDFAGVAGEKQYDPFVAALKKVSTTENVRNVASVLLKMCEIVTKHYVELEKSKPPVEAEPEAKRKRK